MMSARSIQNLHRLIATHPLTSRAKLQAWARFVSWQLASRLRKSIRIEWIGGQYLLVRRGMTGATGNIYVGLHEFADMMVPLHFLREGDHFLDIGANIGTYSILASGVRRAKTLAFEPDPRTAAHLRENLAVNGLEQLVSIHQIALGQEAGHVDFTTGLDTTNRVLQNEDEAGPPRQRVEQRRLDDVLGDTPANMIKLDVEGYEEQVLRGAAQTLMHDSLKVVEIETLNPWIENAMEQAGFERCYYDPFSRLLSASPNDLPARNALFVRDMAFVAERLRSSPKLKILGQLI